MWELIEEIDGIYGERFNTKFFVYPPSKMHIAWKDHQKNWATGKARIK